MDIDTTTSRGKQDLLGSGFPVVVSAPSGAGKTTLCLAVAGKDSGSVYSVSVTSRPQLDNEEEGENYFFMTREKFEEGIRKNEFIEWTEYRGSYYGTPRTQFEKALCEGMTVLLDLDAYGARNMKKLYPACITVYVLAPSKRELEKRLRKRGRDPEEEIRGRLEEAFEEMKDINDYDYAFVNENFEESVKRLCCIIEAEKCRVTRRRQEHKL